MLIMWAEEMDRQTITLTISVQLVMLEVWVGVRVDKEWLDYSKLLVDNK